MTAKSEKLYIDKLPERVHDYYNTVHTYIKMKPVDVKPKAYIGFTVEFNIQSWWSFQNLNVQYICFQSVTNQIGQKK